MFRGSPRTRPVGVRLHLHYERHRPQQTALYCLVQQHAATSSAQTEASTGSALPRFVNDEFDAFLECGILGHGFLRLRGGQCGHDRLLAFSCKRRGFCPSCGARRMPQTAAHRVDHVIPHVPGEEARTLRPLQAAAITYRIAFGPRAGQKWLTLRGALPREGPARPPLCADIDGFSLHAAVRVQAHERKRLEQLCRYITRPALSGQRVQLDAAGQVQLKLKTPWRDGTTHVVMSPLEFMQRLAALVPRPRLHLIRFHGVLAPNARLRALVVPQGPAEQDEPAAHAAGASPECEPEAVQARSHRIGWARLLARVFDIDMQYCPNCGAGQLKIIAAILERPVIEKILTHLGLDPQPPPRGRAREAGHD